MEWSEWKDAGGGAEGVDGVSDMWLVGDSAWRGRSEFKFA